jgi:large subunit ribosomal protein L9
MKLILTREVSGLGRAGDVVTVKDGFARNFLLPRGNAIAWSLGGEKQIEGIRRARASREIRDLDHAKEIKTSLEAATITVPVKVDKDVAAALKSATGLDIDRHNIKLAGHIKKIGVHSVKVSLTNQVVASVSITVVAA